MNDKISICANPIAGSFNKNSIIRISKELEDKGFEIDLHYTSYGGELEEIAYNLSEKISILMIHGGDGTINEAINGLWRRSKPPPLLVIVPGGTANVLGHELGLFRPTNQIIQKIINNEFRRIYASSANGRLFLLMCSAGPDAEIVHSVSQRKKKKFGKFAYLLTGLPILFKRRLNNLQILVNGYQKIHCASVIITNSQHYGGNFIISNKTSVINKELEVIAFKKNNLFSMILTFFCWLFFRIDFGINRFLARDVLIDSSIPVAVQIDGEPFGSTPIHIKLCELELKVI